VDNIVENLILDRPVFSRFFEVFKFVKRFLFTNKGGNIWQSVEKPAVMGFVNKHPMFAGFFVIVVKCE
jgi:hypothetical protein